MGFMRDGPATGHPPHHPHPNYHHTAAAAALTFRDADDIREANLATLLRTDSHGVGVGDTMLLPSLSGTLTRQHLDRSDGCGDRTAWPAPPGHSRALTSRQQGTAKGTTTTSMLPDALSTGNRMGIGSRTSSRPVPESRAGLASRASFLASRASTRSGGGISGSAVARPKPPLVCEIEAFIARELTALQQEELDQQLPERLPTTTHSEADGEEGRRAGGPSTRPSAQPPASRSSRRRRNIVVPQVQRAAVYGQALAILAANFSDYESVLVAIHQEYEAALAQSEHQRNQVLHLTTELAAAKEHVHIVVEAETRQFQGKLKALQRKIDEQQKTLSSRSSDSMELVKRVVGLEKDLQHARREVDEGNQRNRLVVESLRAETANRSEMVETVRRLQKENEKLQGYAQGLERRIQEDAMELESIVASKINDALQAQQQHYARQQQQLQQQRGTIVNVSGFHGASIRLNRNAGPGMAASPANGGGLDSSMTTTTGTQQAASRSVPAAGGAVAMGARFRNVVHKASVAEDVGHYGSFASQAYLGVEDGDERRIKLVEKLRTARQIIATLRRSLREAQTSIQHLTATKKDARPVTPRPKWDSCLKVLPDFRPPTESLSSDDILTELLVAVQEQLSDRQRELDAKNQSSAIFEWMAREQLCESDFVHKTSTFVGKGTGSHVPCYLRFHGRVRNRRLTKAETESLVKRFWTARQARRRAEGREGVKLDQFFLDWLMGQTGSWKHAVEMAYSIVDVCERNQADSDCNMFLKLLNGGLCEDCLLDEIEQVNLLSATLTNADKKLEKWLPYEQVKRILRQCFPTKRDEDHLRLRFALLEFINPGGRVRYPALFEEDANNNQTEFIELLRRQHTEEALEFQVELEESLRAAAAQSPSGDRITVGLARTIIKQLDAQMPAGDINTYLAVGLDCLEELSESLNEQTGFDLHPFLNRVRPAVFLKRRGMKSAAAEAAARQSRRRHRSRANAQQRAPDAAAEGTEGAAAPDADDSNRGNGPNGRKLISDSDDESAASSSESSNFSCDGSEFDDADGGGCEQDIVNAIDRGGLGDDKFDESTDAVRLESSERY